VKESMINNNIVFKIPIKVTSISEKHYKVFTQLLSCVRCQRRVQAACEGRMAKHGIYIGIKQKVLTANLYEMQ